MRYLSDEWFAALAEAVAQVAVPPELGVVVEQVVMGADADGGDVRFRLACHDGTCTIERGPGGADVILVEDRATAVAIATGARTAGHAVLHGDVVVRGDAGRLITAAPLLELLAPAVASVMARTELGTVPTAGA